LQRGQLVEDGLSNCLLLLAVDVQLCPDPGSVRPNTKRARLLLYRLGTVRAGGLALLFLLLFLLLLLLVLLGLQAVHGNSTRLLPMKSIA
jgi:hypothetical protein